MPNQDHSDSPLEAGYRRDVFISHAGPDKDTIVRPFVERLAEREISCWFDEAELRWGESLLEKISKGLTASRYVLVFITEAFLDRPWPEAELRSALSHEISSGTVRVLPIFACEEQKVLSRHPFLRDKKWLSWDGTPGSVIDALEQRLGRTFQSDWTFSHPAWFRGDVWLKVFPRLENVRQPHKYMVSWGRWVYEGDIEFKTEQPVILAFRKIAERESYPIQFQISPHAFVSSGRGTPIVDINRGWRALDNKGRVQAAVVKRVQSLLPDSEP